jgi:serine/threonine-protein kinase
MTIPSKSTSADELVGSTDPLAAPPVNRDLEPTTDANTPASLDRTTEHRTSTRDEKPEGHWRSPAPAEGRYRVLRAHASGGLGEVFVAEDTELHREVALKEMKAEQAHNIFNRQRFLREAEITGRLEHPGIVPIYGLGIHADGRPFYTMRFIRGDNFKEAISRFHEADGPGRDPGERHLALRALLRRFVDVCNAVAYAHSRGVLHRDLKPANVMIGAYGETFVVDWGLAKAGANDRAPDVSDKKSAGTDGSLSGDDSDTQAGSAIGTPGYMSPEQAAGWLDDIGPASDVYCLGATLYQLLTGVGPFRDMGIKAALQRTQAGDFPRPSQTKSNVPPALAAVCLKAMALRPDDRYRSARDLADDIEHWLADEPVAAYRAPWPDRARRWLRRHRTLATSAAALLATALAALAIGLVSVERERRQTAHERDQKDKALQAETQARTLAMNALRKLTDDVVEQQLARRSALTEEDRRFLRDIQRQYEEFAALPGEDVEQRAIRAEGNFRVGVMRLRLGEAKEAEASYQQAVALYQQLVTDFPGRSEFRRELGLAYGNLGLLFRATGRLKEGESAYTSALGILKPLAAEFPIRAQYRQDLARGHGNLGVLLRAMGRLKEAEANYSAGLAVHTQLASDFPTRPEYRQDLAKSHNNLAVLLTDTGRLPDAETAFRDTLAVRKQLVAEFPNRPDFRQDLARSHGNLARLLGDTGRLEEAERAYADALAVFRPLAAEFPARREFRQDLSQSQYHLGYLLGKMGRLTDAEGAYADAMAMCKQLIADFPKVPDHRNDLGATLVGLAILANSRRDFTQARRLLEEAQPHQQEALKANPRQPDYRRFFGDRLAVLVQCHAGLGDQASAVQTANQLCDLGWDPPADAYRAARALAQCVPVVEKDERANDELRSRQVQHYGDHALAALRDAVAKGYKDLAKLNEDEAFDPLRSRDDFRNLVADLEAKAGSPVK